MYKMLMGRSPFKKGTEYIDFNSHEYKENIRTSKINFPNRDKYKIEYSDELKSLISLLLKKNADKRLGTNGSQEVLAHPFFKKID